LEGVDCQAIKSKVHLVFLEEYLGHFPGPKTIVVEGKYVDRDFLGDFASYYLRCFHRYSSKCARLHFFLGDISTEQLNEYVSVEAGVAFEAGHFDNPHYLGFVVVKPLPRSVIGRTCLKTYERGDCRFYPATREHEAHLLGKTFVVESLPFQEQDQVVSACATNALWTCFHATARAFGNASPSPYEITKAALQFSSEESRDFPHKEGLTAAEIARAIRFVGLEPLSIAYTDLPLLKAAVYAYLCAGVPLILLAHLVDTRSVRPFGYARHMGLHAVAVTGFGVAQGGTTYNNVALYSSRIVKLYVHDDQVGPFARMNFLGSNLKWRGHGRSGEGTALDTSFGIVAYGQGAVRAVPTRLVIPVYHKIRIPFLVVLNLVTELNQAIRYLIALKIWRPAQGVEWNVRLTTVNDLKGDLARPGIPTTVRAAWLPRHLPKYLWRATCSDGNAPLLDVILDATDVEQGRVVVDVITYDAPLTSRIRASATDLEPFVKYSTPGGGALRRWIRGLRLDDGDD